MCVGETTEICSISKVQDSAKGACNRAETGRWIFDAPGWTDVLFDMPSVEYHSDETIWTPWSGVQLNASIGPQLSSQEDGGHDWSGMEQEQMSLGDGFVTINGDFSFAEGRLGLLIRMVLLGDGLVPGGCRRLAVKVSAAISGRYRPEIRILRFS
ncbi:hypothetical protein NPIL_202981 [Nephila pilipes]|uniref:Uncharacterized protein n=1 Tax=Nephila pilipes TaxID=299642 RepID=A0A8X6IVM5_NEPPI|nr:hypothetical protein NPIL_202981 [Nephila pilipes]